MNPEDFDIYGVLSGTTIYLDDTGRLFSVWFNPSRQQYNRFFGIVKKCPVCKEYYFAQDRHIKRGQARYCSLDCARSDGATKHCRENNPNWKGGITSTYILVRTSDRYNAWRDSIYARDNWTCQACGEAPSGKLNAHHIIHFANIIKDNNIKSLDDAYACDILWDISNGITLCEECHQKEHN